MSSRSHELAERRALLVARSDAQRAQLSACSQEFERPLRMTQAVLGFANSVRHSPLSVTGLALLLTKTPWRKLARIPKLAWRGWRILQFVRAWTK